MSTNNNGVISFDQLPPGIVLLIYSFLDHKSLCTVAVLGKKYSNYASQQNLWKSLFKSYHLSSKNPYFLTHHESQKQQVVDATNTISDNNNNGAAASPVLKKEKSKWNDGGEDNKTLNWKYIFKDTRDHENMKWKLNQVFGEDPASVNEENVITTVEFDTTGEFLSIGYQCGQIVVFRNSPNGNNSNTYKFYTQFESHHPEFDFLTSLEIEEKINRIRWVKNKYANNSRMLLSTNDKTIKLWKITEKETGKKGLSLINRRAKFEQSIQENKNKIETTLRKVYANAHSYNINSVTLCSDGQLFISSDDLRLNLWNLEITSDAFTIIDLKPTNMNELNEVITGCEFHPLECNQFVFSSSKGNIYLSDMRQKAQCDKTLTTFSNKDKNKSFFSEVTTSISDIRFTSDGRYIVSRDYMHLHLWDSKMNSAPVVTYDVHDHLQSKLYELYESDNIFDKFECSLSGNDLHMVTGSYSNNFMIFDVATSQVKYLQAINPRDRGKKRQTTLPTTQDINFTEKATHLQWHPNNNLIAVAAQNYIYLYHLTNP